MSSVRGQRKPIGWTPPVDDDYFVGGSSYKAHQHPYSPTSSTSSLSETDRNSSHLNGNVSRRHHEPGWVARPRNAFIIFRCEYSQIHSRHGRRIRRPPGSSVEPTLSKRAAIAWSQMTKEQREPYKIRAEEERNEHARKYPDYHFRPQRRLGVGGRRYNTRYSASTGPACTYLSPKTTPEPLKVPGPSVSGYTSIGSRLSAFDGSLCNSNFERRGSISGWTPSLAYNAPEAPAGNAALFVGLNSTSSADGQFCSIPAPDPLNPEPEIPDGIPIHNPSPVAVNLPRLLNWDGEPTAITEMDAHCSEPPFTGFEVSHPFNYLLPTGCSDPLDDSLQYCNLGLWPSQFMHCSLVPSTGSFELDAAQVCDGMNQYSAVGTLPISPDYVALYDASICPAAATAGGECFGPYD